MGYQRPIATGRSVTGIPTGKLAVWWVIGSEIVIFGGVLVFFLVVSVILNYHWTKYGIHPRRLKIVKTVYFGVSAILIGMMLMFLIII